MSTAARARSTVAALIRSGRIIPQPCEECGITQNVEAHHPAGYEGPNALVLSWLCQPHHRKAHLTIRRSRGEPDGSLTLIQAADLLGVTPDNLRGAIARGSLKAEKLGRDWFVKPAEVDRYRKAHLRAARKMNEAMG